MNSQFQLNEIEKEVSISGDHLVLNGILATPPDLQGVILFAHGSGSGRFSPRNNFVARELQKLQFGTLLMDLLSEEEESIEDRKNVFDIQLLSNRLNLAKKWLVKELNLPALKIGFFGASTGAGAAIEATAKDPNHIFAIVSRGGRPDLAEEGLPKISVPTLFIIGGADEMVIDLNQAAFNKMGCEKKIEIVPGATHLFEEPGALEKVSKLAAEWFLQWV